MYSGTGTRKSKGLPRKSIVQMSKTQNISMTLGNRRISMQEDTETLSPLRKRNKERSSKQSMFTSQRMEGTKTSLSWRKTDKERNSRREGKKAGSIKTDLDFDGPPESPGTKNFRVSQVQKVFKEVVAKDFFSIKTFKSLGANEKVIKALESMKMSRPSQIQALSYEHVLNGHSCIIADQTGSGKTLAYLAPLFQRFLKEEEDGLNRSLPNRPRGLVVVPTSELASQVLNVCRLLSKGGAPLKSMVATGGFRLKTQVEALEDCADIVIATPGRFLQLLNSGSMVLDNLKSVVLDEVDVLFDDPEFAETLERIEKMVALKTQYIHVTATLPVDVCDNILEKHPNSVPLMGPGLHCTAAGLQEILVDCSGEGEKNPETAYENKKEALRQLIEQQPVSKTIIFCNKIETCRKVENILKRSDRKGTAFTVLPYHAALSPDVRIENMQKFMETGPGKSMFLVCTDRASRGLDLIDVEHVVLFDFPRDPSEYVRRVGRTARAGGAGKAFVFVVGKQVSLARRIMQRNEKGHPIHSVPSHSY
ncbi:hypothetical protein KP509_28G050700 [Ceratopteris richardii]|nr:hypothetical protein KP509_28G050700 [Ceratopteris richardii]